MDSRTNQPARPAQAPTAQHSTQCSQKLKTRWSGRSCDCGARWECF